MLNGFGRLNRGYAARVPLLRDRSTAMAALTNAFGDKTVTPTAIGKRFVFYNCHVR
jgi:hypothetical protein